MRTFRAVGAVILIGALASGSAQAGASSAAAATTIERADKAPQKGKRKKRKRAKKISMPAKIYTGNEGVKTGRRLTASEKAKILSGEIFAPTTEIVCPPSVKMRKFDIEANAPGKDYGSFLAMRGGEAGSVVREWWNGCEQRLSFPKSQEKNGANGEPQGDFKPVPSPDGKQIAWFRRYKGFTEPGGQPAWKTRVIVANGDGGRVRSLTDENNMNTNPHWTRTKFKNPKTGELGYRVSWSRVTPPLNESPRSPMPIRMESCWNDVNSDGSSNIGQHRCWSSAYPYQFAYSSLNDGRILVRQELTNQLFLVTPNEADGNKSKYEPITFAPSAAGPGPTVFIHKMSISNDETKIAYMKVENATPLEIVFPGGFTRARIAIADFDAKTRTVSNEKFITDENADNVRLPWYPIFSPHNKQLIYACAGSCPVGNGTTMEETPGAIYEYDLASGRYTQISHHRTDNKIDAGDPYRAKGNEYRYPNIWGSVK